MESDSFDFRINSVSLINPAFHAGYLLSMSYDYGLFKTIDETDEARTKLGSLVDEIKVDPPNCLQPWNEKYPKR
jgi:hypothetical protein